MTIVRLVVARFRARVPGQRHNNLHLVEPFRAQAQKVHAEETSAHLSSVIGRPDMS